MTNVELITIPYPDDVIYCDHNLRYKLDSLWLTETEYKELIATSKDNYAYVHPPTDVLVANTVPMPDFIMKFPQYDLNVLVHTDTDSDGPAVAFSTDIAYVAFTPNGDDQWVYQRWKGNNVSQDSWDDSNFQQHLFLVATAYMELWYGIQIALLHPQLKLLFQKPVREKIYTRKGKGRDRKRVVKYVRKHYITPEDIDEALYGHGHRDFERKTMAWYVIGHWRQYKNGTRKFINGYWKGPLREMKRNLDGGRVRQLAI